MKQIAGAAVGAIVAATVIGLMSVKLWRVQRPKGMSIEIVPLGRLASMNLFQIRRAVERRFGVVVTVAEPRPLYASGFYNLEIDIGPTN